MTVTEADFTMQYDDEHTFPFVEDENANITGYGHQDKAEFAALVNLYDEVSSGFPVDEDDRWTADDIAHQWACLVVANPARPDLDETAITTRDVRPGTGFPITTLWGQR